MHDALIHEVLLKQNGFSITRVSSGGTLQFGSLLYGAPLYGPLLKNTVAGYSYVNN